MASWLPAVPYPPTENGFWSPVTSTLNWCEEDYYATRYCAELINCLTNLWFAYLGIRGITNNIRNEHDTVFLYAFISYLFIGLGSFAFHATLKYPMQLLDELCMIYTTCILLFAIFSYGKALLPRIILAGLVTALAIVVTLYYHHLGDPTFHQNVFSSLTALVFFRSWWEMERTLRPSRWNAFSSTNNTPKISTAEQSRRDRRDEQILKVMYAIIPVALCSVAAGFAIWTVDNNYCSTLRRWRRNVGLPWGVLLEGHGWWHLLTGIAEYHNIVWSTWLRYCVQGRQDEVDLIWPSIWSMPYVQRRRRVADSKIV